MSDFERMDPEMYREKKQKERNNVFELLSSSTQSLMEKEQLRAYLDLQAALFDQTVSNVLLIKAQRGDATWVRTSEEWKQDGIYVNKGEKGISVLEGRSYQRKDGSIGTSFDVSKAFDITQTSAKDRNIRKYKYRNVQDAVLYKFPIILEVSPAVPGELDAFYDRHQEVIFVKDGLGRDETFNAIARELVCYELLRKDASKSREDVLPYAEAASYILAKRYGITPKEPDLDSLIQSFEGKKEKDVRKSLSDARQSATAIDYKVKEHQKLARSEKESER